MKKHLSLFLAFIMAASAGLTSCSGNGTADESVMETTPDAAGETSAVVEETEADPVNILSKSFTPELQEELQLAGYETRVLLRQEGYEWSNPDIVAYEATGDRLNDAVFNRNAWLAEQYGFTIIADYSTGAGNCDELKTLAAAGDDVYDMAFPQARAAANMAQAGVLRDLYTVPYLDFDNPTWSGMLIDMLRINGNVYYAAGDISVNSYEAVMGLLFNKPLAANLNLSDPYALVRDGDWTLDNFDTMCTIATQDLNGDGSMTADDQWGMVHQTSKGGIVLYYGCGEHLVGLSDEDIPFLAVGSERSVNVYDKVSELLYNTPSYYECGDADTLTMFQNEKALFLQVALVHVNTLRQSDVNFGILPLPKWNTEQKEYVQTADGWCVSPLVIPSIVGNIDRAGFIAQAFAEASSVMIKPEYYDIILKGKLTRDQESGEMLDIIYKNFVIDPADIYQWGGLEEAMIAAMRKGQEVSSVVAQKSKQLTTAMENTLEQFKNSAQ